MVTKKIIISNQNGVDAREAVIFVQTATKYVSTAWIEKGNIRVNAKSIMGLISLALAQNDDIILKVSGKDEEEAADNLEGILNRSL